MTSKKVFHCTAITAVILLATSNVVFAEDYQLPATVNNPVVMPVGADEFQNGVKNAIIKDTGTTTETVQATKPTTALPSLSPASSASPAVNEITGALSNNPTLAGYQQQVKSGNFDSYGRPAGKEPQQNAQSTGSPSKADELYVEASVSTSTPADEASIFVNGGDVFISTNTDKPIGIMLSEDSVPESTYNLTLVPLDVPGAMISVTTSLSPTMQAKRETSLDKQNYDEMLARSQSEELTPSDPRQDDHKQRIIDLLTPVALGEVPSGFSLQEDRLSRIPSSEQSPCNFNMYAKLGQRLVGSRELIDVVLVKNDKPYGQVVADQQCITEGVVASALFDKAFLQPGEETELYIVRDKLFKERQTRVTTRPSLIKR